MLGAAFSPAPDSGASIFTKLELDAGCNGVCEPSAWEERLRADDGYITQYTSAHPDATETAVNGSDGVVLTSAADVSALVLRWDDRASKYFSCEVSLEEGQEPLLAAFVAACTGSKPAWFPVS